MRRLAPRGAMDGAPDCVLRPVVALDIDGTSGYYHEHFARYARDVWGYDSQVSLWDGTTPFWREFGCSKPRYREMKLGYRQGRMKRSMPVAPGAAHLTQAVRRAGAELWVCTTRPYLRLDNIDPDTRYWLRRNGFQYDGVLFGESKYRDLVQLVGSGRVVAVLDDDPAQVRLAERYELPAILISRMYNREGDFTRAATIQDATEQIVKRIALWRQEKGV